jgi:hypothetical protein
MIPNRVRYIICGRTHVAVIVLLMWSVVAVADDDTAVPPAVTAFFRSYCIDCHGTSQPEGDFRVDALRISANAADAENWQLVLDNLQLGEMPPRDARQPDAAEKWSLPQPGFKPNCCERRLNSEGPGARWCCVA